MSLLSPWGLAWLGLLVPLVLLYVLKRRRETKVVGSTLLWEQALRDLRAERPWRRLVPQVALLLQALAIAAGALALARPVGAGAVPSGAHVAVVVDVSASMAGRTRGERRIDRARALASSLVESLPPGGRMMLLEAGSEASVLAPLTSDASTLRRALGQLAVRGASADLEGAVALAAERLRGAPAGSHVLLLTDGAEDGEIALAAEVPVEVRRVVPEQDAPVVNTGIVAADCRPAPGDAADAADVFVRVAHVGDAPVDVFVTASIDGGPVVASRRLSVEPDGTASAVMRATFPPDEAGRAPIVRLQLSRAADEAGMDDDLDLDDVAVVPSPGRQRLPVFLVGDAPAPVLRVLQADPRLELFETTLARLARRGPDQPPLDGLFVYTGEVPDEPPAGDSIVIAPAADRVFELEVGAEVLAPRIVTWDEADPRLRFVSLGELQLISLRPLRGGGQRLVETDRGAAIVGIARPDGETTVLGFDPAASNWPRQASFVVFFRNLLQRARRRRDAGGIAPGTLGEPLRIPAPDGTPVVVTTPAGHRIEAVSRGGLAVVPVAAEPGVYRAKVAGRELHALRSLLDPGESDLRPRVRFSRAGAGGDTTLGVAEEHHEAWPWLAALLLLLLVAEIAWATRRPEAVPR